MTEAWPTVDRTTFVVTKRTMSDQFGLEWVTQPENGRVFLKGCKLGSPAEDGYRGPFPVLLESLNGYPINSQESLMAQCNAGTQLTIVVRPPPPDSLISVSRDPQTGVFSHSCTLVLGQEVTVHFDDRTQTVTVEGSANPVAGCCGGKGGGKGGPGSYKYTEIEKIVVKRTNVRVNKIWVYSLDLVIGDTHVPLERERGMGLVSKQKPWEEFVRERVKSGR
uniref:PDZ domain-containing protein n=1 Tax=Chromera velia CCMP2878 TaxID=1169474 RepID=A0A0G4GS64_9ALVE|eukprot:Cvel_5100.t1-p1 / transcript=Cvel_5100.t1 / gene=Cvel_5100 / organism=Chromera_velia_CCMP2878 / gene_product=hypothetical protein / transcript_product=hypothetical protein / location=Cvel_scaffold233:42693-45200(+) / protein_length=220 / sequence_SO=supercontig / SO=protein_coding / is_pseudo=false